MKKYIPVLYVWFMIGLFLIIPIIILALFYATDISVNLADNVFMIILYAIPILGIIAFNRNKTYIQINLNEKTITNNVTDSRKDWNWIRNIDKLIKVELICNKQESKRVFGKKYIFSKMLVFSFHNQELKYISASLFSNKQIEAIINCLTNEIRAIKS